VPGTDTTFLKFTNETRSTPSWKRRELPRHLHRRGIGQGRLRLYDWVKPIGLEEGGGLSGCQETSIVQNAMHLKLKTSTHYRAPRDALLYATYILISVIQL
jgi:hypothetical protein